MNLVLIAQCLGLWDAVHWRTVSERSERSERPIPLEAVSPTAQEELDGTSMITKRRGTTALTEPSVSCDLCPEGDDFCMELG